MKFAERLCSLRNERKVSQAELAKALKVSTGTIGNYETGTRFPKRAMLEAIADYFNVGMDYLMGYDDSLPEYNLEERLIVKHYREASERDKAIIKLILGFYNPEG